MRSKRLSRSVAIGAAGGLALAGLSALLAAVVMAAPQAGFLHLRRKLSGPDVAISSRPSLAVSPDDDDLVVIWTEGYEADKDTGHVYLRAASETGAGWEPTMPVFTGSESACAYKAAVAVMSDTAHVAYVVFDDCTSTSEYYVYYKTCSLTSTACSSAQEVAMTDTHKILWVDLALDTAADPHVVWAAYDQNDDGSIWYRAKDGAVWGAKENVQTNDSHTPAVAWQNGYVHAVYRLGKIEGISSIGYSRRDPSRPPSDPWEDVFQYSDPGERDLSSPDVAAWGSRVYIVWEMCHHEHNDLYCDEYNLLYRRSNDDGATWPYQHVEVGTNRTNPSQDFESVDPRYAEHLDPGQQWYEYVTFLQPAISLDAAGWPAIAWHAGSPEIGIEDFVVYYTYATSGTAASVTWAFTNTWVARSEALGLIDPAVIETERMHHLVYMNVALAGEQVTWDIYYDTDYVGDYTYLFVPLVIRDMP